LVWRFCLRVFAGAFFLLLLPPLSLVAMWRLPSDPPLGSSDSALTLLLWQETSTHPSAPGAPDAARGVRLITASKHPPLRRTRFWYWRPGLPLRDRVHRRPQRASRCPRSLSGERRLWVKVVERLRCEGPARTGGCLPNQGFLCPSGSKPALCVL
jgi:hypothetical protein